MANTAPITWSLFFSALLLAASSHAQATPATATLCTSGGCAAIPPPVVVAAIVVPPIVDAAQKYKCKRKGLKISCTKRWSVSQAMQKACGARSPLGARADLAHHLETAAALPDFGPKERYASTSEVEDPAALAGGRYADIL